MVASHPDQTSGKSLDRFTGFSDGVFAIAITILALELTVPILSNPSSGQLWQAIRDEVPNIFSFTLSFVLIGRYWMIHHNFFQQLRSYDNGLIWFNLLFLMTICFLPFPTGVLGEYGDLGTAAAFYAAALTAASLAQTCLYTYALRRPQLLVSDVDLARERGGLRISVMMTAIFAISIPIALLVSATAAELFWLLTFLMRPVARRAGG